MKQQILNDGRIKDMEVEVQEPKVFANLTYDPGFKIVLGTEGKSERLLMSLLNHILGLKIVNVKYLPTERLGLTEEESKSFFDVYCKDSSGRRYLIEMQMWGQHYFHKRAVYYSSLSVQDQARVEKEYQKRCERVWDYYFAPVYQISFLNFPNTLVEPKEEGNGSPYISHYVYKSKDTGRELGDETNIVFVDLAKFRKKFEECDNQCERWLYSIKNMHLLKSAPIGVAGTELEELYGEAHFAAWTPEKRSLYEKSIMNRNDYENILCERYEDGFAAGIEEGREEGRVKGREEGLVLAAKNMIAQGLPIDVIMQVTGLSEAELEKL